jgi:hypothetical protein
LRTYQTEFHLSTKGLNPKAIGAIGRGASDMGVPLERYMQIRRKAVDLFKAGQTNVEVMAACGITAKQASNWRTRAGAAGLLAESLSSPIERSIQTNLAKASEAMGETVEVYLQKRSRVYQMLARGLSPPEVARELNIPLQRVHNWANSTARGRSDAMAYA